MQKYKGIAVMCWQGNGKISIGWDVRKQMCAPLPLAHLKPVKQLVWFCDAKAVRLARKERSEIYPFKMAYSQSAFY